MAEGLADEFDPVEHPHRRQHLRRVSALPPPRLDQLPLAAPPQEGVEEEPLRVALDQPRAELDEHRGIEARVVQVTPQEVLPVDAAAHGVGRLPIRQPLPKLEERHQRQSPRCERRLPMRRGEGREGLIGEQRAEFVCQTEVDLPFGEGGTGNAGGIVRKWRDGLRAEHSGLLGQQSVRHMGTGSLPTSPRLRQQYRLYGRADLVDFQHTWGRAGGSRSTQMRARD